jgi:hypothetical protein
VPPQEGKKMNGRNAKHVLGVANHKEHEMESQEAKEQKNTRGKQALASDVLCLKALLELWLLELWDTKCIQAHSSNAVPMLWHKVIRK